MASPKCSIAWHPFQVACAAQSVTQCRCDLSLLTDALYVRRYQSGASSLASAQASAQLHASLLPGNLSIGTVKGAASLTAIHGAIDAQQSRELQTLPTGLNVAAYPLVYRLALHDRSAAWIGAAECVASCRECGAHFGRPSRSSQRLAAVCSSRAILSASMRQ